MTKRTWLGPALFVSGFGLLSACNNVGTPSTPAPTTQVNGARPSWATPGNLVGSVGARERIDIQVHLAMRNEKDAEAELAEISDPDSARFGQFLSDEEFAARYAPTAEDIAAVVAHLEQNGLTVNHVPANRAYVAAVGTAAQVENAFATKLATYDVAGETMRAPVNAAVLPAALGSRVSTVFGLSTGVRFESKAVKVGGIRPQAVWQKLHPNDTVPANTCSEWFGAVADTEDPAYPGYSPLTYAPCGYRPGHLRSAYGLSDAIRKGNDGKGQSIAIVDAYLSPTLLLDAQTYAANNDSDYPLKSSQFSAQMAPGTPSTPDTGWYGEQTLDVEAAHAMAPGAKIVYVGAQSAYDKDLIAAINLIVEKKLASVISNSYGMVEQLGGNYVAWHAIATQAGLKGIGIYFSSGDSGDEADRIGSPSADFPASLDNVTAVGGTSLAIGRTGELAWELGWETSASFLEAAVVDANGNVTTPATWFPAPPGWFFFGAGGGTSFVYEQPKWQKNVVPTEIANVPGTPARAVPDVSMLADPITGFKIGQTDPATNAYSEYAIGGTSLACPLFAATVAVAQQNAGKKFGFANPLFYKKRATAFRDVKPSEQPQAVALPGGIAVVIDYQGLTIKTAAGWDNVTGLGVPNGKDFLKAIK
ncbi:MAG: serine protease [Myxococcales bacterium]|nr:serine protease [Myxococcales bacterium]